MPATDRLRPYHWARNVRGDRGLFVPSQVRVTVELRQITLCLQAAEGRASLAAMSTLPAICQTCGTIFRSGNSFENSTNITRSGNLSGPCPQCGRMGRIPDGLFSFIGEAAEAIESSDITTSRLQELIDLGQHP